MPLSISLPGVQVPDGKSVVRLAAAPVSDVGAGFEAVLRSLGMCTTQESAEAALGTPGPSEMDTDDPELDSEVDEPEDDAELYSQAQGALTAEKTATISIHSETDPSQHLTAQFAEDEKQPFANLDLAADSRKSEVLQANPKTASPECGNPAPPPIRADSMSVWPGFSGNLAGRAQDGSTSPEEPQIPSVVPGNPPVTKMHDTTGMPSIFATSENMKPEAVPLSSPVGGPPSPLSTLDTDATSSDVENPRQQAVLPSVSDAGVEIAMPGEVVDALDAAPKSERGSMMTPVAARQEPPLETLIGTGRAQAETSAISDPLPNAPSLPHSTKQEVQMNEHAMPEKPLALSDSPAVQPVSAFAQTGPHALNETIKAVQPHHFERQVLQHLEDTRIQAGERIEISLSPEELGRVRLSASRTDHGVVLVVQAERPETLELMRRHLPDLMQDLRNMGFANVDYSGGEQNARPRQQPDSGERIVPDQAPASPVDVAMKPALSNGSGLDLRL